MDGLDELLLDAGPALLGQLRQMADEETRQACSQSLYRFVQEFWDVVEPGREFVHGWHLEWMCRELEAITDGETIRALFNVPPGAMKPISVDEYVLTRRGRIRLGDVVEGDSILTHRGRYRRVEAVHSQGMQQTLLVTTEMGRTVKAELSHPFLTTRGWIAAQDLRLGDVLAAVTPMEELSSDMTLEEARFLGYIVGDGGVTHSPQFTNTDEDILLDFERCASALDMTTRRRIVSPSMEGRSQRITIGISGSLKLLERHGLLGKDSYTKRIPEQVLRSSNEIIANFLGAYWSCDGTIHIRHKKARGGKRIAVCTTVGRDLAGDIQHALLRLGIACRVRARSRSMETSSQPGGIYCFYNVIAQSHEETAKFERLRGLCPRKARDLEQLTAQTFEQGPLHEDPIVSIEVAGLGECRCLTVADDHSFTANDIAVHNSLLVSVFWPTWEWGPRGLTSMRYLLAAYTQTLTLRDNRRAKMIMNSPKFRRLWPAVEIDPRRTSDENFANTRTGWRIATSPGGLGTGERADRIIIDDPHSVKTADSDAVRNDTLAWWREVIPTRVNDPQTSAIVVIMQRVHEDDVSGDILDNRDEGWVHLMIQMRFDPSRRCVTAHGEDPRTEAGELYWPERFPEWTVVRDSVPLGRFGVAAQFQQMPAPKGGGIISDESWQLWPPEDDADRWMSQVMGEDGETRLVMRFPRWEVVIAYLDTAFTEKEENAWCALTRWGVFADTAGRPRVMLAQAWRDRPTLRALAARVLDTCRHGSVDYLVIENRAGAEWVKQELQRLMRDGEFTIVLDEPRGDKVARLHAVSPLFEDGVVFAPQREWADMVIKEVSQFPKGKWKDLCLIAGTRIATRRGLVSIERVDVTDDVLTPVGWRRVISAGLTGMRPVIERAGVCGTANHPVYSLEYGFIPLDMVSDDTHIGRLSLCGLIRTIRQIRLNSTGWNSVGSAESDYIMEGPSAVDSLASMSPSGNMLMGGACRMGMRYIISTVTLLIAALTIWNAYQNARIAACLRGLTERLLLRTWQGRARLPAHGIVRMRGKRGIVRLLRLTWNWLGRSFSQKAYPLRQMAFATGAEELSHTRTSDVGFVVRNAVTPIKTLPEAGSGECQITSWQMVYNLTVAEAHCYYANGVLVHNCDTVSGGLGYLRRSGLIKLSVEHDEDEREARIFRGNRESVASMYGVG